MTLALFTHHQLYLSQLLNTFQTKSSNISFYTFSVEILVFIGILKGIVDSVDGKPPPNESFLQSKLYAVNSRPRSTPVTARYVFQNGRHFETGR